MLTQLHLFSIHIFGQTFSPALVGGESGLGPGGGGRVQRGEPRGPGPQPPAQPQWVARVQGGPGSRRGCEAQILPDIAGVRVKVHKSNSIR